MVNHTILIPREDDERSLAYVAADMLMVGLLSVESECEGFVRVCV